MKKIIFAFILLCPVSVFCQDINGTNVTFVSPDSNLNEVCAQDQEQRDYINLGTDPNSLLLTCFIDMAEWERGNGTIAYKVEIVKKHMEKILNNEDFFTTKAEISSGIKKFNAYVSENNGDLLSWQERAIQEIKSQAGKSGSFTGRNSFFSEVESTDNYIILQNIVSANVSGEAKLGNTFLCFINLKGKLLTLKSINTLQDTNTYTTQLAAMKSWVKSLQLANAAL